MPVWTRWKGAEAWVPTLRIAAHSLLTWEAQGRTSLLGSHLTGHSEHVTVEASPAAAALAVVLSVGLPALATILAGSRVTPAHKVLRRQAVVSLSPTNSDRQGHPPALVLAGSE